MASTMNATKLTESSVFSLVRCSTSSQTTASEGSPGAAFSASSAASDIEMSCALRRSSPRAGSRAPGRSAGRNGQVLRMIHVRIVAPEDVAHRALEVLSGSEAVLNIVHLHGVATKPPGDVILCDVAREDASVILGDLKELEIPRVGSIAVEHIDISMSDAADEAEKAAPGLPSDAVVWEEVEQRTSENTELSVSFVLFMV